MQKLYSGRRTQSGAFVTISEGHATGITLNPRFDLRYHSPDGFEWGYCGSGPAQLSIAMLADALNDDMRALGSYQNFKNAVVAALPHEGWLLTQEQVINHVKRLGG